MKTSLKSEKKATIIKKMLPQILHAYTNPVEHGFISIIQVDVSTDGMYADVYIQHHGGPADTILKLNKIAPKLSHEIIQSLPNRKRIELRFKKDTTAEILKKIESK